MCTEGLNIFSSTVQFSFYCKHFMLWTTVDFTLPAVQDGQANKTPAQYCTYII